MYVSSKKENAFEKLFVRKIFFSRFSQDGPRNYNVRNLKFNYDENNRTLILTKD